jgi:phage/plasmid-associated DNA primase
VADFRERYEDAKEDKRLYDKLKGEADGILAILCWAAKWWYDQWETGEGGMVIPDRVREQSKQFMDRGDPVARFISVACRTGAAERGQAAALYESYSHWHYRADEDGEPLGKHKFAAALERKGFKKIKRESGLFYVGIAPKSAMDLAVDGDEDGDE